MCHLSINIMTFAIFFQRSTVLKYPKSIHSTEDQNATLFSDLPIKSQMGAIHGY